MKTEVVLALSFLLVSWAEAFSEPDCSLGCDLRFCTKLPDCKCGTYKDYCECCTYCLGCPGEPCNLVAMDQCANGTTCKPPANATGLDRIQGPAWCM